VATLLNRPTSNLPYGPTAQVQWTTVSLKKLMSASLNYLVPMTLLVPEGDEAEFKSLVQKANDNGLAPRSGDSVADMKKDIEEVRASIAKIKAGIATREAAYNAKISEITKVLAEAKSPELKSNDASAENKVLEAEAALSAALDKPKQFSKHPGERYLSSTSSQTILTRSPH
jgi:hypothetical protein